MTLNKAKQLKGHPLMFSSSKNVKAGNARRLRIKSYYSLDTHVPLLTRLIRNVDEGK